MATTLGSAAAWRRNCTTTSNELVGVMDDDVLLADGGEAIAVVLADALGEAADEGLELEIGPIRRR